jgi:hypothetical protein
MGLWAGIRTLFRRVSNGPWETGIAVTIPVLLALLAVPVMLGAFASETTTQAASGGYGTTTTAPLPPPPTEPPPPGVSTLGSEILPGSNVVPCASINVKLAGFMVGSGVEVFLLSTEIKLSDFTADANGDVIVTVAIPADFTGTHAIEGRGIDPDGNPHIARVVFTLGTPACATPTAAAAVAGFTG